MMEGGRNKRREEKGRQGIKGRKDRGRKVYRKKGCKNNTLR